MARKLTAGKAARRDPAPTGTPTLLPGLTGEDAATFVVPPDENIFVQGQVSDAVYYLRAGTAKGHMLSKAGQEAIITLLGPGDFFGESAMVDNAPRVATVTTMTECTIDRIEPEGVRHRLASDQAFTKMFL